MGWTFNPLDVSLPASSVLASHAGTRSDGRAPRLGSKIDLFAIMAHGAHAAPFYNPNRASAALRGKRGSYQFEEFL